MNNWQWGTTWLAMVAASGLFSATAAWANGGPFVIQYPGGDPSAKGVLARLHPDLKPGREERLRVIKEDLTIEFESETAFPSRPNAAPLVRVTAAYQIENPTDAVVEMEFGFPVLRGIYIAPFAMMPVPEVQVNAGGKYIRADVISNSAIYGLIRRRARATIDQALAKDQALAELTQKVQTATTPEAVAAARRALADHLKQLPPRAARGVEDGRPRPPGEMARADGGGPPASTALAGRNLVPATHRQWSDRDVALFVEFASVNSAKSTPVLVPWSERIWSSDEGLRTLSAENLGVLSAIGDQKATQLFARLAGLFDPATAAGYEAIFSAWGGDVRERAVDLTSGKIRPRENAAPTGTAAGATADPTVYARVDYLDPKATQLTAAEKTSCRAILQNLPVVFTFAPMNLLHYQVNFAPQSTQSVTVAYKQFAYTDTAAPASYQLAYVVHPASLWKSFGPIELTIKAPADLALRASVPCAKAGSERRVLKVRKVSPVAPLPVNPEPALEASKVPYTVYRGTVTDKTGELFIGMETGGWDKLIGAPRPAAEKPVAGQPISQRE